MAHQAIAVGSAFAFEQGRRTCLKRSYPVQLAGTCPDLADWQLHPFPSQAVFHTGDAPKENVTRVTLICWSHPRNTVHHRLLKYWLQATGEWWVQETKERAASARNMGELRCKGQDRQ